MTLEAMATKNKILKAVRRAKLPMPMVDSNGYEYTLEWAKPGTMLSVFIEDSKLVVALMCAKGEHGTDTYATYGKEVDDKIIGHLRRMGCAN